MSNEQNPNCDGEHCTNPSGEVRNVPVAGGTIHLCRDCFIAEMMWRATHNQDHDEKMPLLKWEAMESYAM